MTKGRGVKIQMKQEETSSKKKRSRRRKGSRVREIFMSFVMFLFILVLIAGLTVAGVIGYRYWEGSRISDAPLETSREVVTETMLKQH